MTRHAPLATALLAAFATPAWPQTDAGAPRTTDGNPALASATLPAVAIDGERDRESFRGTSSSLGRLEADLRDVPQSVTVINKALLQTQGATSLADALRNVPGITLGGAEGGQIGNNINLNGFTARTDIYLDGFRDRGQYYRDVFALDAIEVLMGPSSMLFGRGSTGGVINQVSKRPTGRRADEAAFSVTSNGMVRATVDHDQPLGADAGLRIAAMAQEGHPTTRDVMKNRDVGVAPSLRLGIGGTTEITLYALLQHNRDMPDYGVSPLNGHPAPVPRDTFYGFTDDRLAQDIGALTLSVDHRLSTNAVLRNRTQLNAVRTDAIETASQGIGTVTAAGFVPLPNAASDAPLESLFVRLQSHDRVIHDRSLFNQTELALNWDGNPVSHRLLLGMEIGHDRFEVANTFRVGSCNGVRFTGTNGFVACEPLLAPPYAASPSDAVVGTGNLAQGRANSLAAFANDTLSIGSAFKIVAGVRRDRFQARVSNSVNSGNTPASTAPARADQTVGFTSLRLGGIWQPSEAQSYYVSTSTSFNPSLEQLTNTTGTTAPLPPERNRAVEVGGKWDPSADASLNAAVFRITKTDARSQGSDGIFTATGRIRVDGLRAGAAGRFGARWKVFAGYTFLDAEIVDGIAVGTTGKVPTNTPRHAATLWTTYAFAPHWELGAGALAQSRRFANNTNLVSVERYARFDAMLAWRQPNYDIRLNVFNLTDRMYYDALIQSDGGRAVPGTGRTAMLSLWARF